MSVNGKWVYANNENEEMWQGLEDTPEAAAVEAFGEWPECEYVFVSPLRDPFPPEEQICADRFIDFFLLDSGADDYSGEWAEDWLTPSEEQEDDLELSLQKCVGEWLDRHKLRPRFGLIADGMKAFAAREDGTVYEVAIDETKSVTEA